MKSFMKFCFVGISNTVVTFFVFYILSEKFGINYLLSSLIGYIFGVINSFILNKSWTFKDKNKRIVLQFIRFSLINVVSLAINLTTMYICVEKLFLSNVISQIIATGFTTITNYIGSRAIVFEFNDLKKYEEQGFNLIPKLNKNK